MASHVPTFYTTQKRRRDRPSTYLDDVVVLFDRDGSDLAAAAVEPPLTPNTDDTEDLVFIISNTHAERGLGMMTYTGVLVGVLVVNNCKLMS